MNSHILSVIGGLAGGFAALILAESLRRVRRWWGDRNAEWDPY
jgi:hypothetical protein